MCSTEQIRCLKARYPDNTVLTDHAGNPAVTVYVPMFLLSDVIAGARAVPHPAFVRGDRVLDGIYVSKFQNVLRDGVACALPDEDPATGIDYDGAVAACRARGTGWHLMTAMEWGAIALWCHRNGCMPYGNNGMGKDYRETEQTARIAFSNAEKPICRTATGSGPNTWNHNGRADGIADLNANVWEWVGGLRLVYGELQVLSEIDAPVDRESDAWRAIDGRTGKLILPSGNGTTEHSVKLDFRDGVWVYTAGAISDMDAHFRFCAFADVSADETVGERASELLLSLGLLGREIGFDDRAVALYANNGASERIPFRGGRWGQEGNAGVFKTCFDDPRTYAGAAVGFRAVYDG
jgi:hypothetical protein